MLQLSFLGAITPARQTPATPADAMAEGAALAVPDFAALLAPLRSLDPLPLPVPLPLQGIAAPPLVEASLRGPKAVPPAPPVLAEGVVMPEAGPPPAMPGLPLTTPPGLPQAPQPTPAANTAPRQNAAQPATLLTLPLPPSGTGATARALPDWPDRRSQTDPAADTPSAPDVAEALPQPPGDAAFLALSAMLRPLPPTSAPRAQPTAVSALAADSPPKAPTQPPDETPLPRALPVLAAPARGIPTDTAPLSPPRPEPAPATTWPLPAAAPIPPVARVDLPAPFAQAPAPPPVAAQSAAPMAPPLAKLAQPIQAQPIRTPVAPRVVPLPPGALAVRPSGNAQATIAPPPLHPPSSEPRITPAKAPPPPTLSAPPESLPRRPREAVVAPASDRVISLPGASATPPPEQPSTTMRASLWGPVLWRPEAAPAPRAPVPTISAGSAAARPAVPKAASKTASPGLPAAPTPPAPAPIPTFAWETAPTFPADLPIPKVPQISDPALAVAPPPDIRSMPIRVRLLPAAPSAPVQLSRPDQPLPNRPVVTPARSLLAPAIPATAQQPPPPRTPIKSALPEPVTTALQPASDRPAPRAGNAPIPQAAPHSFLPPAPTPPLRPGHQAKRLAPIEAPASAFPRAPSPAAPLPDQPPSTVAAPHDFVASTPSAPRAITPPPPSETQPPQREDRAAPPMPEMAPPATQTQPPPAPPKRSAPAQVTIPAPEVATRRPAPSRPAAPPPPPPPEPEAPAPAFEPLAQLDPAPMPAAPPPNQAPSPTNAAPTSPQVQVPPALPPHLPADLVQAARRAEPDEAVELILDPAELGRVRFELAPGADRVQVTVSVERPETLDLLRRNIDLLRAEFREAGFDAATLNFGQWGQGGQNQTRPGQDPAFNGPLALLAPETPLPRPAPRPIPADGGLDLRL